MRIIERLTNKWWKRIVIVVIALILVFRSGEWIYDNYINVKPYEQQVVLITGTASGIGEATAKHLVEQGHVVYGGDIQFEKNRWLDEAGGHALDMDVTDVEMVKAGVAKVIEEQGRIDVLFNNAGYGLYGPIEEVTMEDVQAQFDVNVFGYANLVKEVLPHMREQGDGLIINNTSMGGKIYLGGLGGWYHASKHALEGWSDVLRFEVDHFGIDVVIIEPGAINTNFGVPVAGYLEKYRQGTAYEHLFIPFDEMTSDTDSSSSIGAEPIVIAEAVNEAMNAHRPHIRYTRGPLANELIIFRDIFGDRAFDLVMQQMF